jgi:maltose/moltooligosaccharide transporter
VSRLQDRMSLGQILNMNAGFLGIQFGWGLQMANMSAIYEWLGASPDAIPMLWLAAPMTGLLVQPIIGAMSDRTWGWLGRRRPYFLVGAVLSSLALFVMPDVTAVWMAALLLWVLDASINISMEPFRAFVADKLSPEQRVAGFVTQSFFIGLGATLANLTPWFLSAMGVTGQTASGIPVSVQWAFKGGAGVFLAAVLWTIVTTGEEPPSSTSAHDRSRETRGAWISDILSALRQMPALMRRLAVTQVLTWLGLFCMWLFFAPTVARHVFGALSPQDDRYRQGVEWAGVCFSFYSIVCFVVALVLPALARRLGMARTHAVCLALGGAGLCAVSMISSPSWLLLSMLGVGVAWASILAMPYAMLSVVLPPARVGVYMGIFNFFIVLPEIVAALGLSPLVRHVFGNDPRHAVTMGGVCLLLAALSAIRLQVSEGL